MNQPVHEGPLPSDQEPGGGSGHRPHLARSGLSGAALASFILGLLFLPLNIFVGIPAIWLGYHGLYAINASEGQLRGRVLAVAGMIMGVLGCFIGVCFGLVLLFSYLGSVSARVDSANNLRQVGLALQAYQNNHQKIFPRAAIPNPHLPPAERLSWMAAILPYLERKRSISSDKWRSLLSSIDTAKGWQAQANASARDTNINTFLCRGQAEVPTRARRGLTDYVGLSGIDPDAILLPLDSPRAGLFGYDRTVSVDNVAVGQSYLMVAAETALDNGPWIAAGRPTVRGVDPDQAPLIGVGRPFGGFHFSFLLRTPGLNTLNLDSSVHYFTDEIPPLDFAKRTRLRP